MTCQVSSIYEVDYDKKNDILRVSFSPNTNTYGSDVDSQVVALMDLETDRVIGVMIYSFMEMYKRGLVNAYEKMFGISFKNDVLPLMH